MGPKIGRSRVRTLDLSIRILSHYPLRHWASWPPVLPFHGTSAGVQWAPQTNDLKSGLFRKQQRIVNPSCQLYFTKIKLKRRKLKRRKSCPTKRATFVWKQAPWLIFYLVKIKSRHESAHQKRPCSTVACSLVRVESSRVQSSRVQSSVFNGRCSIVVCSTDEPSTKQRARSVGDGKSPGSATAR